MDYESIRDNLVAVKLQEYGKAVTLRRPGSSVAYTKTYDPIEGRYFWTEIADPSHIVYTDPATSTADTAGYAVEVAYEQTEIDGTNVKIGDRRFKTISFASPTTSDKLVVDSVVLNIVSAKPIQPGSVTLIWTLQCRA